MKLVLNCVSGRGGGGVLNDCKAREATKLLALASCVSSV